ncbi:hypothetical protein V6N11_013618 [Hibiscus sabdariffa]|uniref:Uncharacterized protein n=1 Tax=Hibiscus sabdariffa TaxID=183260 RepID=A0ABR1ZY01_9ROSI
MFPRDVSYGNANNVTRNSSNSKLSVVCRSLQGFWSGCSSSGRTHSELPHRNIQFLASSWGRSMVVASLPTILEFERVSILRSSFASWVLMSNQDAEVAKERETLVL